MIKAITIVLIFFARTGQHSAYIPKQLADNTIAIHAPAALTGNFKDDYEITYRISDSLWLQYPSTKFHILKWDTVHQYLVARNDEKNVGDQGLYTRIDYMLFHDMPPYSWGYCLTVYNAATESEAVSAASADRQNPKKGCNGFPFSRMRRTK